MKLKISHTTTYTYDQPVQYALQRLRLTPKNRPGQEVLEWDLSLEGGHVELDYDDHHNNRVMLASCEPGSQSLVVTASGMVVTSNNAGILGIHGGYTPLWYFSRSTDLTKAGPLVRNLVKDVNNSGSDQMEKLHTLSAMIADAVTYKIGNSEVDTNAEDALANGAGVCQDHAHVFLSAVRLMKFPARYVSGYLMMNDRVEQDATHAWVEVHVTNLGWVGFDISNRISPDERYIPVATGLDYLEAAPISGMRLGDSAESMIVNLQVQQ